MYKMVLSVGKRYGVDNLFIARLRRPAKVSRPLSLCNAYYSFHCMDFLSLKLVCHWNSPKSRSNWSLVSNLSQEGLPVALGGWVGMWKTWWVSSVELTTEKIEFVGAALFSFFFFLEVISASPIPALVSSVICLQTSTVIRRFFPFMLRFSYMFITKSFLFCRNRSIDRTLHLSKKVSVTFWVKIMMRPLNKSAALLTSHRELNKTELHKIMWKKNCGMS